MKRSILASTSLLLSALGCTPVVLDPIESGPTSTETRPFVKNAVAMSYRAWAELPHLEREPMDPYIPPYPHMIAPTFEGSLALFFSDRPMACDQPLFQPEVDPAESYPEYGPYWQLLLVLPPELAGPGLVDLRDNRINSFDVELGPPGHPVPAQPSGNVGNAWAQELGDSSLAIGEAEGGSIPVHLLWMPSTNDDYSDEYTGDYDAVQCGEPPPAAPPTPGLILRGADVPPRAGEPPPDPERLYLFLGDAAHTCEDPYSPMACTQSYRVMVSLPPDLQAPGILDLTDPALEASFIRSAASAAICDEPQEANELMTGEFEDGTVEILHIDEQAISLRLYGSHTFGPTARIDADGVYLASMCP